MDQLSLKVWIFICFTTGRFSTNAQTEAPVFGVRYEKISASGFTDSTTIPGIQASTRSIELEGNYGWLLGKRNELSVSFNYKKIRIKTTLDTDSLPFDSFTPFYTIPSHANLSLSGNLQTRLKKNWSWMNSISLSLGDDFFGKALDPLFFAGASSFVEKRKTDNFRFGGGVFINQFKNRLFVSPIFSLLIKNDKRGLELLFPERIRFWQNLKSNSYLALTGQFSSYTLLQSGKELGHASVRNNISNLEVNLMYYKIFYDFLRLEIGIGLPLRTYTMQQQEVTRTLSQSNGLLFRIGCSLTVSD